MPTKAIRAISRIIAHSDRVGIDATDGAPVKLLVNVQAMADPAAVAAVKYF